MRVCSMFVAEDIGMISRLQMLIWVFYSALHSFCGSVHEFGQCYKYIRTLIHTSRLYRWSQHGSVLYI